MQKEDVLLIICAAVFLAACFGIVYSQTLTGYATESTTTSQVVISTYFSIDMSANMTAGILFGTENSTSKSNVNGTANYNEAGSNITHYNMSVSSDSNTVVDFDLSANHALNDSDNNIIGLGNETYANSTVNNISFPALADEVAFTTSGVEAGDDIAIGGVVYYRFWLDIPAGQAPGTYNNTITFEGSAGG